MNKFAVLLLIAVSSFVSFAMISNAGTPVNETALHTPTPRPKTGIEIEKIELDKNEIKLPCPPGKRQREEKTCDGGDPLIKIKVSAVNPPSAALVYYYTVSGGRIIGRGESVSWDLSGVRPGTYTVTAAVDDGNSTITKTLSANVEVRECNCGYADACPVIVVSAQTETVKAGEIAAFTASVSGESNTAITYNWTVSTGEISEGQGTPKIKVKTAREMAGSVLTATVEISGDSIASICGASAAATASITK